MTVANVADYGTSIWVLVQSDDGYKFAFDANAQGVTPRMVINPTNKWFGAPKGYERKALALATKERDKWLQKRVELDQWLERIQSGK